MTRNVKIAKMTTMLFNTEYLQNVFSKALPYKPYLATGNSNDRERWGNIHRSLTLTDGQEQLLTRFTREMNILVLSGIWCGDCVEQCPMLARIAESCQKITLRFLDRDQVPELRDNLTINQGHRVPVALFMAEDYALCSVYGDRTLTRYRIIAQKRLGAACSTGLFPPETNELTATLQDWLNEIERIQIMLQLSPRLRSQHKD
ncbi:MAG: thioredoxin family protein [Phycisphaerae bacterium]|nr:thioredoxin family protein [Phycisphaerae bacterium]